MALEAATYILDLDAANPLATDKKNQGDDHLRLLKSVLRNSFPNISRAFRLPEAVSKSANYAMVEADDNKTIYCDTSAGAFTLTLPAVITYANWIVRVIKISGDASPVYVVPPSGNINGFSKIRCNLLFTEYVFIWTGGLFLQITPLPQPGEVVYSTTGTPAVGYALAAGQALTQADCPELFSIWGTFYGNPGAGFFSAPDLRDKFPVGGGNSYAIGATGGSTTVTLTMTQLPSGFGGLTAGVADTRTWRTDTAVVPAGGAVGPAGGTTYGLAGKINIELVSGTISASVGGNLGSDGAHENRPPYQALYPFFRLC